MVQQALITLATQADERPATVGLRAFLGRAIALGARTLRRTARRRTRREQRTSRNEVAPTPGTVEDRDEVDAALERLSADERQVIVLRFLHDLEYAEVAHIVGATPGACRLKVHRALAKLRGVLGKNAPALIATGTLLYGTLPASALTKPALQAAASSTAVTTTVTGGVLVMSKFVKAAAVIVAAILLVSFWPDAGEENTPTRANRAATKPADETAALAIGGDAESRETARTTNQTAAGDESAARPAGVDADDEPVSAGHKLEGDWASYDQSRAMGKMNKRMRGLKSQIEAMRPPGMRDPQNAPARPADETTQLHLRELVAKYKKLESGGDRFGVLRSFVSTHKTYVKRTGDTEFLVFIEDVANGGSKPEQPLAVSAVHGVHLEPVLELLRRALQNANEHVRSNAVDTLAEMSGELALSAHDAIVGALEDRAARPVQGRPGKVGRARPRGRPCRGGRRGPGPGKGGRRVRSGPPKGQAPGKDRGGRAGAVGRL